MFLYHNLILKCLKNYIKLNEKHYCIIKIPDKREFQQIVLNHWADNDFQNFMKLLQRLYERTISFLVNDTTLPSDNPLKFRKNLL